MKINVSPDEFADFCILFLFDCMANKKMLVQKTNGKFRTVIEKLVSLGFKSIFMMMFFAINPTLRQRYSQMRDVFDRKSPNQHYIYISQDVEYDKKARAIDKKEVAHVKKAINNTVKMLTAGKVVDPRGLALLQERVINKMLDEGDL